MPTDNQVGREHHGERDDLDHLLAEIRADPVAFAVYQDAQRRIAFLSALAKARSSTTQKHVAAVMGTQQSTVSELESGRVDPRLQTLQRYARAVGQRLEIALVDPDVPLFSHGIVNRLWPLLRQALLAPLLTELMAARETPENRRLDHLAEIVRLSPEFLKPLFDSLEKRGWLTSESRGLNGNEVMSLNSDNIRAIGIDVHHEHIDGVLVGLNASHAVADRRETLKDSSPRSVTDQIHTMVLDLYENALDYDVIGVGVSLAGVVGAHLGDVRSAPDLMQIGGQWSSVPFEGTLQEELRRFAPDLRVVVENDANAVAVQEYLATGDQFVLAVLLSVSGAGIGSGMASRGRVWHGADDAAGEIGHLIINPASEKRCRTREHSGCLEAEASIESILHRIGLPGGEDLARSLAIADDRAANGDEDVQRTFEAGGEALGAVLAPIVVCLNPSAVVVRGQSEVTDSKAFKTAQAYQRGVRSSLSKGRNMDQDDRLRFQPHENASGALAASAVVVRHFLDDPVHWVPSLKTS